MARRNQTGQSLDTATVHEFERLKGQLKSFYSEFSILSKKNPNEPLNTFKLKLVNTPIKKATDLLGDSYRPIADFDSFTEESMPTTSDVGVVLSQYLTGMERFKKAHIYDIEYDGVYWRTHSHEKISAEDDAE